MDMVVQNIKVSHKIKTEKKAIKLVLVGDVLMAVLGLSFYYMTNSQAILMDGVYPFIDLISGLLALRVVSLMTQQTSQAEPFGYAIFEPVLNFIKGILILLVIIFALYASVEAILHGGRHIAADIAVFYSIIASILGFGLSYILHRMNKTAESSLIDVDLQGWVIGSILSVAVGISFALAIWMQYAGYESWVPYTDPIVILLLILLMVPIPLKILKENGLQIIGRTGSSEKAGVLQQQVESVLNQIPYLDMKMRYLQAGRMVYVRAYVQMDPQADFSLQQQDDFRDQLYQHLSQLHDYISLDVVFTAKPILASVSIQERDTGV